MIKRNLFLTIVVYFFIVACHLSAVDNQFESRIYFVNLIKNVKDKSDEDGMESQDVIDNLKKIGFSFSDGGKLVYYQDHQTLVITETPAKLAELEKILGGMAAPKPLQVFVEVAMVKIKMSDIENIPVEKGKNLNENVTAATNYRKIVESDKAEVQSSCAILTSNGQEATLRMVFEEYFPESWSNAETLLIGLDDINKEFAQTEVEKKDDVKEPEEPGEVAETNNVLQTRILEMCKKA